jgi:hypothetical protein
MASAPHPICGFFSVGAILALARWNEAMDGGVVELDDTSPPISLNNADV